jgi:excisionase family DNA binding protein
MMANLKATESAAHDGFASVKQAEAFLSLSRSTVYTLMDQGKLRFAKIGRSRRIPWAALREFAAQCLVGAAD